VKKPLRCMIDAICGAVITCVVAVGFVGALELLFLEFGGPHPIDRENDLHRLPRMLSFAAVGGLVLGAFAGLSSRLTDGRISFLQSTPVVGVCMVVARLLTFSQHKTDDPTKTLVSYAATLLAALLGVLLVFLWGIVKKRSGTTSDRL
jgi:hypothetical protein